MRKVVAAVVAALCPLAMAGLLTACEMGLIPFWGMIAFGAACIYAEWWGLTTFDNEEDMEK